MYLNNTSSHTAIIPWSLPSKSEEKFLMDKICQFVLALSYIRKAVPRSDDSCQHRTLGKKKRLSNLRPVSGHSQTGLCIHKNASTKKLHLQMYNVPFFLCIVPIVPNLLSQPDTHGFILLACFAVKLLYCDRRKCPSVYINVHFCMKQRVFWSEHNSAMSCWRYDLHTAVKTEELREDSICDGYLTIKSIKLNVEKMGRETKILEDKWVEEIHQWNMVNFKWRKWEAGKRSMEEHWEESTERKRNRKKISEECKETELNFTAREMCTMNKSRLSGKLWLADHIKSQKGEWATMRKSSPASGHILENAHFYMHSFLSWLFCQKYIYSYCNRKDLEYDIKEHFLWW